MQNTPDRSSPASNDSGSVKPAANNLDPKSQLTVPPGYDPAGASPLVSPVPKKVRPASRNCLNRHAVKKPEKKKEEKIKRQQFDNKFPMEIGRYDDTALFSANKGLMSEFIVVNADALCRTWQIPNAVAALDSIRRIMLAHPVFKGGHFAQLLDNQNAQLVVAVVDCVSEVPLHHLKVTDTRSTYCGEYVPHRPLKIVLQASGDLKDDILLITEERWLIGARKCKVMKGFIDPPYLVIAAIDRFTGLTLRARVIPVYLSPEHSALVMLRSGYERSAMANIVACGGVGFTPQNKEQLSQLQVALGHRWAGDLTVYPSLPDVILFPPVGGMIVVLEIYGLCGLKKYDESTEVKEAKISAVLGLNKFIYLKIDKKHLTMKTPAADVIRLLIKEWFAAKPPFLWRNAVLW